MLKLYMDLFSQLIQCWNRVMKKSLYSESDNVVKVGLVVMCWKYYLLEANTGNERWEEWKDQMKFLEFVSRARTFIQFTNGYFNSNV